MNFKTHLEIKGSLGKGQKHVFKAIKYVPRYLRKGTTLVRKHYKIVILSFATVATLVQTYLTLKQLRKERSLTQNLLKQSNRIKALEPKIAQEIKDIKTIQRMVDQTMSTPEFKEWIKTQGYKDIKQIK